ncbi:MAG TPA: preprotein translocase subunit SecE [Candidatus Pacearchaeota archaeon]|mgnify:FL=1|nr:preprotein translocase subunit SecE [Candidatus Pacearchaeota archaeon]HRR94706.1 preprotein translocase subunit SecE [Candidatus Paceibacterota bacterium]HPC30484.1 preprotein translocase subunit SecE [Candidatus Pacearchaeota archaeon]HQG09221.1 preprotein translocase subunit SecE [Candidatus Pacearchaeota archaeon]HQH20155.1 preprotein translocase subunit SecE [Candidatus Pacearchaeota archaeon]
MKSTNPIINFFSGVGAEIKKITWPTKQETIRYTITVIIMILILALFLGFFDFGLQRLLDRFVFNR